MPSGSDTVEEATLTMALRIRRRSRLIVELRRQYSIEILGQQPVRLLRSGVNRCLWKSPLLMHTFMQNYKGNENESHEMGVQLPATEHAVIVFSFCMAWCSVSTAAYMDVFVFAKTRKDYVTATEEFGMEPSMRAAVYSAFYLGWLFGDPLFGWIADKWGRHPSVYGAVALGFVFQASCALAIGQYSLFVLRFLAG
ncbi:hypothetical protein T484DRAFT_1765841 [Baffinella frigidus]|nr:hypothetical protein T484DRAFT_1765841 [Cryptophyta sp. CCMP2293]